MDSVLVVDPNLVTEAVRSLALNTLGAYQNGVSIKWNDAELAIYLVYIFGEINKCDYLLFPPAQKFTRHCSGRGKRKSLFLSDTSD